MKKISVLLIAIITVFSFNINSKAEECINGIMNSSYGSAACRKTTRGTIVATGDYYFPGLSTIGVRDSNLSTVEPLTHYKLTYTNNNTNDSAKYTTHYITINGSSSYAFCLDPLRSGHNTIYAERILLDSGKSMLVQTYDVALMSAMTSNASYIARSTAIRLLTAIWGFHSGAEDGLHKSISFAYFGQAYNWINSDNDIKESYNELYNILKGSSFESLDSLKTIGTANGKIYEFSNYGSGDVKGETLRVFKQALREAVLYTKKENKAEVKMGTTKNANVSTDGEKEIRDSYGSHTQISKTIVRTINLRNFTYDGNASFILNGVKWKQAYKGIQDVKITGVKVNGKEISNYIGVNLLQGVTDYSNITIDITINFTGIKETDSMYYETLKCNDKLGYIIDYTYNDSTLTNKYSNYVGVVWKAYGTGSENKQRFVTIDAVNDNGGSTSNGKTETPDFTIELIEYCDCSEMIRACKNDPQGLNSAACKTLEKADCGCEALDLFCKMEDEESCNEFDEICNKEEIQVECDTVISNEFQCCDENNKVVLLSEEKTLSITGPTDALCFTNKNGVKDEAGNSYKNDSISNKYCSVSCKEDYEFYMPSAQKANSGRYFTLGMKIKGTKTCYTSEIDKSQYYKDIIEAQTNLINAYNEYQKWKALTGGEMGAVTDTYTSSCACGSGESCGPDCETSDYDKYWKASAVVSDWIFIDSKNINNGTLTYVTIPMHVTDTDVLLEKNYTVYAGSVECSDTYDCDCTETCDTYEYEDCDSEGRCHTSISESCSETCSTCECEGRGSYESIAPSNSESDYRQALKTRMNTAYDSLVIAQNMYKKVINDFNNCTTFDNIYNFDPEVNYEYEDRNNYNYKESNMVAINEIINDGDKADLWYCKGSLTGSKYDGCSSKSDAIKASDVETLLQSVFYIYCTESGCINNKEEKVYVGNSYVKKTALVEATYRPKTLYYYIKGGLGAVTKIPGSNTEPLENGIPVSKSTSRGIYHYGLNITNLGEYYGSIKYGNNGLGRLSGNSNSVLAQDEFKDMVNYNNGYINYDCSYLVNMGKLDGQNFVCNYDCPTCDYICVGSGCNDDCSDGKCDYICIGEGCIYNEGSGSTIYERQVSLHNLFPEGTTSRNWNTSSGIEGLASKASATINEIETKAEKIYDEAPILSVTISPSAASNISRYNEQEEKNGGYSNETLSCYNLGGYESAACFSSFINEILNGNNSYGVRVNENTKNGIRKNRNTNVSGATGEYFEMWSGYNNKYSPDANEPSQVVIGPSWK